MTGRLAQYKGAIAWMARNPVASNLLMIVLMLGGLMSMFRVQQEVFPEFSLNYVSVVVPYPGATPEQTEEIVRSIEQAIANVDGIKKIIGGASEAVASVTIELQTDIDANKALGDIENAIDRITTFPLRAEEPQISLLENKREVISLVFYAKPYEKPLNGLPPDATSLDRAFVAIDVGGVGDAPLAIAEVVDALRERLMTADGVAHVDPRPQHARRPRHRALPPRRAEGRGPRPRRRGAARHEHAPAARLRTGRLHDRQRGGRPRRDRLRSRHRARPQADRRGRPDRAQDRPADLAGRALRDSPARDLDRGLREPSSASTA